MFLFEFEVFGELLLDTKHTLNDYLHFQENSLFKKTDLSVVI